VLNQALAADQISSHAQARALLADQGVIYQDDSRVFKLFRRHGIKVKTGRYRHVKADVEAQAELKKLCCRTPKAPHPTSILKVLSFDEARFGLITWHKRRYRHRGERPDYLVQRKQPEFRVALMVKFLSLTQLLS